MLSELKALLREATAREHELLEAKSDLEEKVHVLSQFPPGARADQADVVRDYQQARYVAAIKNGAFPIRYPLLYR